MGFKLLYWKHLLTVQCLCVCLQLDDATIKFIKQNQQSTLECNIDKQVIKYWQVEADKISAPKWVPLQTTDIKAIVNSNKTNILNLTVISKSDIRVYCQGTEKTEKYLVVPLYNDNGNLYPSSETPNAIKDKKFTLRCKTDDFGVLWLTGNGSVIAKYIGLINQNYSGYFGRRQETHCQKKICALSITNISLDDDNISIVCKTNVHTSLFNIRVFVLPKSVRIMATSDTVLIANQKKTYECLIIDTNLEFSVIWQITLKNGTQKNVTKHISNKSSKSGKLTTLSSKLALNLNKEFKELQCVAYFPGDFAYHSMKLDMSIKYPPQVNIDISEGLYNATIINCTAFNGTSATYEYKLKQKWGNATKNTYNKNVLSIDSPSFNNSGTWECHVNNKNFHVIKQLNYKIPVKPVFSSIFNDLKRNVSIGNSVVFKQCFYSDPKSDVKWQINDKLIDPNKYSTTDYLSSEYPFKGSCTSLTIEDIKNDDFGTYTLTVENTRGKEMIIFTLRSKEITEVFWGTRIGYTVGSVLLLITLGLVAYKFHKVKAVNDHYVEHKELQDMCRELSSVEHHYFEICEYQNICPKLPDVEDEHAEDSEPKYVCMKQPDVKDESAEDSESKYVCMKQPVLKDMDVVYVNIPKKPEDMDYTYANVLQKLNDVEDEHAEDSEPKYVCMKQPVRDVAYVNLPRRSNGYQ